MKIKIAFFILILLLIPGTAVAGSKLGIIEVQRVLETSEPGRQALGQLTLDFEDMREDLEQERSKVEQLRQELQKQSMVLSQEAQQDMETELRQKMQQFQQKYQSYQIQMQQKEEELSEPIIDLLFEIINNYAAENDFDMIFDAQGSGLIFAREGINITGEIIEEVNKAWEAGNN